MIAADLVEGAALHAKALVRRASPTWRAGWDLARERATTEASPAAPRVVIDLRDPRVRADKGRYLFRLVHEFVVLGHVPAWVDRYAQLAPLASKRHSRLLLDLPFEIVEDVDAVEGACVHLCDHDGPSPPRTTTRVEVVYARRRPRGSEVALSYGVHPPIALHGPPAATVGPRPARVLFAGNTAPRSYDHASLNRAHGVMTRRAVVRVAKEAFEGRDGAVLRGCAPQLPSRALVTAEGPDCVIPDEAWLPTLAQADFFLAAPGTHMPLCHNLVEAMWAGCVPILEHARYLDPPLRDGVDCLAFDGARSLREVLARAVAMEPAEVERLRAGVRAYVARWLRPGAFAEDLLARPGSTTVLLRGLHAPPG